MIDSNGKCWASLKCSFKGGEVSSIQWSDFHGAHASYFSLDPEVTQKVTQNLKLPNVGEEKKSPYRMYFLRFIDQGLGINLIKDALTGKKSIFRYIGLFIKK